VAPEGHGDLVARVDVIVPVGPLEALLLHVESMHLLAEHPHSKRLRPCMHAILFIL
jgi:hypothetical protein